MTQGYKFIVLIILTLLQSRALAKSEYKVIDSNENLTSITLLLSYTGKDTYYLKPTSPIIRNLVFTFNCLTFSDFTFKIVDPLNKRFEVPQGGVFPMDPYGNFSFPISNSAVDFTYTENPFDFRVVRKQNGAILFSTYNKNIIYSDRYLEIGTQVDSAYIYGLGERFEESFRKKDGKWTIFNRDRGQTIDRGQGLQTYGYYPFYLLKQRNQLFHISYFRSSNAMDVIKQTRLGQNYITYKVIGGVIDFRFFLGEESPEITVQKLHMYSGPALVPPFWSLGFHEGRRGYKNQSELGNMISKYQTNQIPLDTISIDMDYMINNEDFTIDQSRFPLDYMTRITNEFTLMPVINAGITIDGAAYEQGIKQGVFITDANGKRALVAKDWSGSTTFVDFFQPNATKYWQQMLDNLYNKLKFSGIWLNMNEVANFCDGPCNSSTDAPIFDYSKDLPYQPGVDMIESHTIPLNSTHYGNISQANVHVFYSLLQTHATYIFLKSKKVRPFTLSRSSTLGSNKYGFHWTGDNYASFEYLKGSIADSFNNQLFGFQMNGANICGYGGNTTEQLCARWFQLGSLYTFARNFNSNDSISQQAYALGDIVLQSAKNNLFFRLSLLKYFYYLFVSKRGLGTIWRPLYFEFPKDPETYSDDIADSQFMIGAGVLVTPIVEQGKVSRSIYLPKGNWLHFHSGTIYKAGTQMIESVQLTDRVPLFLREGHIIYHQDIFAPRAFYMAGISVFNLTTNLRQDTTRSNFTHKIYISSGAILSISDYSNDTLVDNCLLEGCQYTIKFQATVSSSNRTLQLVIGYQGSEKLAQNIDLHQMSINFDNYSTRIWCGGDRPCFISGPRTVNYILPSLPSHLLREQ